MNMFGMNSMFGYGNPFMNMFSGFGGFGCNSIFNSFGGFGCGNVYGSYGHYNSKAYNGMAGFAIGGTLAMLGTMIGVSAINKKIQTNQDNSVQNIEKQIDAQLAILGVKSERDVKNDMQPEKKYDEAINAAKKSRDEIAGKISANKAKIGDLEKLIDDAKENASTTIKASDGITYGKEDYTPDKLISDLEAKINSLKAENEKLEKDKEIAQNKVNTADADKQARKDEIDKAIDEVNRLIEKRNAQLFDDADGSKLFRTSKDKIDEKIKESKTNGGYKDVSKANLKGALSAYAALDEGDKDKDTYKNAFLDMCKQYKLEGGKLDSELQKAYDLITKG